MKSISRKHRSPEQWRDLIQQWQESGLSASAFCKQNDLGYASFCQWRKRLTSEGSRAAEQKTDNAVGFIDLGAMPSTHPCVDSDESRLTIHLRLGAWLNLSIRL